MTQTTRCGVWTLLLTCVLSTTALHGQMPGYSGGGYPPAAQPDTTALPLYATRQSEFAIPFNIDRRVAQPVEVHLYVSIDQGKNWRLQSRQPPTARQFLFRASGDGEYWFASRTIGAAQSNNASTPRPELRVVVDTVPPQIELTARPNERGEVLTAWQLFDQNLLASSLKVEYQEGVGKPWRPVSLQLPNDDVVRTSLGSQVTWWPETRSPTINVRAEVRDRAGNLATASRRLLLPALVAQQTPAGPTTNGRSVDPFARARPSSDGGVPWPSDNRRDSMAAGTGPSPLAQRGSQFGTPPLPSPASGHTTPTAPRAGPFRPDRPVSAQPASAHSTPTQLSAQQPGVAPYPSATRQTPFGDTGPAEPVHGETLADTSPLPDLRSGPPVSAKSGFPVDHRGTVVTPTSSAIDSSDVAQMLPPGERPQMTRSPRFQLAYDVDAVGASGLAEVQLWATADAGRTWRMWGTDDDLQSPFEVAVEEQGIFGFHVVVVGKNGMAGRRPRTGDLADIWVGVDTTTPTAELTAATYGDGADTGKLIIQWRAADQYLDPRPITLSFGESPDGPWTTIVSALPNSGRFAWPADPQLPSAVFLKLDVRDEAGNVVSKQTPEPVRIDGLAPKARIRGIQPLQDMDREAFRLPRRG